MNCRKFLALSLSLIMMLSIISCKQKDDPHGSGNNDNDAHDVTEESQGGEGTVTYVYSVVSKTLHLPGCYHIERMNEDYKFEYTGSITVLLEKGYTICKDCLVPDTEEEKPKEEDYYSVSEDQAKYAYNNASRVIHELDCHNIDSMNEENLRFTDLTIDELLELEHIPCGSCMPDEYKEYQKNHPEKD